MSTLDITLLIIGAILQVVGLIGAVLPVLPGAPLTFAGMVCCCIVCPSTLMITLTVVMGILVLIGAVLDYVAPTLLVNKAGGSKKAKWGTNIGLIAGLLFAPPLGVIIGPFLGAFVGEMMETNKAKHSFKVAGYSFLSFLLGTLFKLLLCFAMIVISILCVGVHYIPDSAVEQVKQWFSSL